MKRLLPALALPIALLTSCRKKEPAPAPESASTASPLPPAVAGLEKKDGMVRLPGGTFTMGNDWAIDVTVSGKPVKKAFPEESPAHQVTVDEFWIDETEVTNAQFAAFIKATNYITFAERPVKSGDAPGEDQVDTPADGSNNGGIVFRENAASEGNPKLPGRPIEWWRWDAEANWRQPAGKGSSIAGKDDHPVVCLTHEDAAAFAKWAGKRLPTEAEWEFAARGGLEGKTYVWGDDLKPGGQWMANIWQGEFPHKNSAEDGFSGSAPVRSFPPNAYGLYEMAGNVWEMCGDHYDPAYFSEVDGDGKNPQGPAHWVNRDTGMKNDGQVHHVVKGGSFLCHDSYSMRYRPAARYSQDNENPTNHTGFRCVKSAAEAK